MEKSSLFLHFLFAFEFFEVFLFLLEGLLKAVRADTGDFAFLLVKLDLIEVSVFGEFLVNFSELGEFLKVFHIPWLVGAMVDYVRGKRYRRRGWIWRF